MFNINLKSVAVVAALVLTGAASVSTAAATSGTTRSVQVRYGDLDLASASGRTVLDQRIRAATHRVCSGGVDYSPLADRVACMHEAYAKVAPQMLAASNKSDSRLALNVR